jgi:hypothetical protein
MLDLEDGWVLSEVVFSGTHTGEYGGVPATGSLFRLRGASLQRFDADGLLTNHSVYYDNVTLMTQITTPEWSPEGQWITAAPTPLGNLIMAGYWIALDTAKTRFTGQNTLINNLPLLVELYPDATEDYYAGAQAVKVARNTYNVSYMQYFTKNPGSNVEEIVGMAIISGTFELFDPDNLMGQGTASYYLASQDTDQDGFPDDGQEPVACFPTVWTAKRPPMFPGCTPAPMP